MFDGTWTNKSKKQLEKEEIDEIMLFKLNKMEQKSKDEERDFLLEIEAENYGYYESKRNMH